MWSQFTNLQTDRQTDRQTTCDGNTALCTKVHRAVKNDAKKLGRMWDLNPEHFQAILTPYHYANGIHGNLRSSALLLEVNSYSCWSASNPTDSRSASHFVLLIAFMVKNVFWHRFQYFLHCWSAFYRNCWLRNWCDNLRVTAVTWFDTSTNQHHSTFLDSTFYFSHSTFYPVSS